MLALFAVLHLVAGFIRAREIFPGVPEPRFHASGRRWFFNLVRAFDADYVAHGTFRGWDRDLVQALRLAGYDVYHVGEGVHVVDLTSASGKKLTESSPNFLERAFYDRIGPGAKRALRY